MDDLDKIENFDFNSFVESQSDDGQAYPSPVARNTPISPVQTRTESTVGQDEVHDFPVDENLDFNSFLAQQVPEDPRESIAEEGDSDLSFLRRHQLNAIQKYEGVNLIGDEGISKGEAILMNTVPFLGGAVSRENVRRDKALESLRDGSAYENLVTVGNEMESRRGFKVKPNTKENIKRTLEGKEPLNSDEIMYGIAREGGIKEEVLDSIRSKNIRGVELADVLSKEAEKSLIRKYSKRQEAGDILKRDPANWVETMGMGALENSGYTGQYMLASTLPYKLGYLGLIGEGAATRYANLTNKQYGVRDDGSLVVIDNNDEGVKTMGKAVLGAATEVGTEVVLNHLLKMGGKKLWEGWGGKASFKGVKNTSAGSKIDKGITSLSNKKKELYHKLEQTEKGQFVLDTIKNFNEIRHMAAVGSMFGEWNEEMAGSFADNVLGLDVKSADYKGFSREFRDWVKKDLFSSKNNIDLLLQIAGTQVLLGAASGAKSAHDKRYGNFKYIDYEYDSDGNRIPETDDSGNVKKDSEGNVIYKTTGLKESRYNRKSAIAFLSQFADHDRIKKLDNTNLFNLTRLVTSESFNAETLTRWIQDVNISKRQRDAYKSLLQTVDSFDGKDDSKTFLGTFSPETKSVKVPVDRPVFEEVVNTAPDGTLVKSKTDRQIGTETVFEEKDEIVFSPSVSNKYGEVDEAHDESTGVTVIRFTNKSNVPDTKDSTFEIEGEDGKKIKVKKPFLVVSKNGGKQFASDEQEAVSIAKEMSRRDQVLDYRRSKRLEYIQNKIQEKAPGGKFIFYDNARQYMDDHPDAVEKDGFHPDIPAMRNQDGSVTFILDNIKTPFDIDQNIRHEEILHGGLDRMFPSVEDKKKFLKGVYSEKEIREQVDEWNVRRKELGLEPLSPEDPRTVEEIFVHTYDSTKASPNTLQKIDLAVKRRLSEMKKRIGLKGEIKYNKGDIEALLDEMERQASEMDGGSLEHIKDTSTWRENEFSPLEQNNEIVAPPVGKDFLPPPETAEEKDARYQKAFEAGDIETARTLVDERAKESGYVLKNETGIGIPKESFRNKDAVEKNMEDSGMVNLWGMSQGIDVTQEKDFESSGRERQTMTKDVRNVLAYNKVVNAIKRAREDGESGTEISMFQAVPKDEKGASLKIGAGFVSPIKEYAREVGNSRLGKGNYRIIENKIPIENVWWDGKNINEWTYDDGNNYFSGNTKNNMKRSDEFTKDKDGKIIPLSKRFNKRNSSPMYNDPSMSIDPKSPSIKINAKGKVLPVSTGTLFSGGGSVEAALKGEIHPVFAVEMNNLIGDVYKQNHGDHVVIDDVRNVDMDNMGKIYYLHASPVCKNFSSAKKTHGGKETGIDMATAMSTAQAIEKMKPEVFTLENVKQYKGSASLKIITDKLTKLGYKWDANVYRADNFGGATTRERLILRAVKNGTLPPIDKGVPGNGVGWYDRVKDLIEDLPVSKSLPPYIAKSLSKRGVDWRNVEKPIFHPGGYDSFAFADSPAPTITATHHEKPRIIMPGGIVKEVSPRVLARIQGLPDTYKLPNDYGLAKTIIGNGVPVELTRGVISPLLSRQDGGARFNDPSFSKKDNAELFVHPPTSQQKIKANRREVAQNLGLDVGNFDEPSISMAKKFEEAREIADDTEAVLKMIDSFKENPRPPTTKEAAAMTTYASRFQRDIERTEHDAHLAEIKGNFVHAQNLRRINEQSKAALADMFETMNNAGREWGRSGKIMQAFYNMEMDSFDGFRNSIERKIGTRLEGADLENAKKLYEDYKDLKKKYDDLREKKLDSESRKEVQRKIDGTLKNPGKHEDGKPRTEEDIEREYEEAMEYFSSNSIAGNSIYDLPKLTKMINALYRKHIQDAIKEGRKLDEGDLVKDVHGDLDPYFDGLSDYDIRQLLTGYGNVKIPDQSDVEKALRDIRGQARVTQQLEDLANEQLPKKTGTLQDKPSDEMRAKEKERNRKLKEFMEKHPEFSLEKSADRLKSAIDSIRTRIQNEIADLTKAIETGIPLKDNKRSPVQYPEDVKKLKADLEELRKVYDLKFRNDAEEYKKAVEIYEKVLSRRLQDWESRYEEAKKGNFDNKKDEKKPLESDLITSLKDQIKDYKERIKSLKESMYPGGTPEEIARWTARRLEILSEREEKYRTILMNHDFGNIPKRERSLLSKTVDEDPEVKSAMKRVDAAKRRLADEVRAYKRRHIIGNIEIKGGSHLFDWFDVIIDLPRLLKSTLDLSAVFGQGAAITAAHPKESKDAFVKQLKAFASEGYAEELFNKMQEDPDFDDFVKAGGKIYNIDTLSSDSDIPEEFRGVATKLKTLSGKEFSVADFKLPFKGDWAYIFKASERAYATYLNVVSFGLYKMMKSDARFGASGPDSFQKEDIARFVNTSAGYGFKSAGRTDTWGRIAQIVFWAPRLMVAAAKQVTGYDLIRAYYNGLDTERNKESRRAALNVLGKELLRQKLAQLAWAVVINILVGNGDDPEKWTEMFKFTSTNFMSPRIGNMSLNFLGPSRSFINFLARTVSGVNYRNGKNNKIDRMSALGKFVRSKFSPNMGILWSIMEGKEYSGEKYTPYSFIKDAFIPMSISDINDALAINPLPLAILAIPLILSGGIRNIFEEDRFEKEWSLTTNKVNEIKELMKERSPNSREKIRKIREDYPLVNYYNKIKDSGPMKRVRKIEKLMRSYKKEEKEIPGKLEKSYDAAKEQVVRMMIGLKEKKYE